MYFHYQNLKNEEKGTKYISNGRFWLGQSPQLHCQWIVPGRDLSFEIDLNHYGETAIGGNIGLWLFKFYWGIEWRSLYKLLEKITRRRDQRYTNGRSIGFYVSHGAVSISLWNDPMESRRDDPWWWHKYFDIRNVIFGRSTYKAELLEERNVLIPMPEKAYEATAKLMLCTWSRPRWFSKSIRRVEINVPEGLPHEGKGENSWDCGVDRTYSLTTGACNSIAEGVGKLVGSVLHSRVKYGGYGDWNWQKS